MASFNFAKTMKDLTSGESTLSNISKNNKAQETFGSRYIPSRDENSLEKARLALNGKENKDESNENILQFCNRKPFVPLASVKAEAKRPLTTRNIPKEPFKVLDAPGVITQFYLNLIDWSANNFLAVGLQGDVYVWNSAYGSTFKLMSCQYADETVSSLKWSNTVHDVIGVGTNIGRVQLFDSEMRSLIRTMSLTGDSASCRISSLAWKDHILTTGSQSGGIHHHDIRVKNHEISSSFSHEGEVCGLSWSPNFENLASGSNDNKVLIWNADFQPELFNSQQVSLEHRAAVKALAWCPWKPKLLATGGGLADHTLHFWNVSNGSSVKEIDVGSQVCGVVWSEAHREILTAHGENDRQLSLWKYPNCEKIVDLSKVPDSRAVSVVASPDKEYVATLESSETIKIWHCFKQEKKEKSSETETKETDLKGKSLR